MTDISVVIPTSRSDYLDFTLQSLSKQRTTFDFEVVVVENPKHTDHVEFLCSKYGYTHIVCYDIGANNARNHGIKIAKASLIGLLDDDVILCKDWIERAVSVSKIYPSFGILGGRTPLEFGSGHPKWGEGFFRMMWSEVDWPEKGIVELEVRERHVVSANMVFRKEVWEKLGGLDCRVGYSGTDMVSNDELEFQRTIATLYKPGLLYDSEMIARHIVRPEKLEIGWLKKRFYGQGKADALYYSKVYDGKPLNDIFHDVVQHQGIHFIPVEETAEVREKIANEDITREYIKRLTICKTAYMAGLVEGLMRESILDFGEYN